MNFVSVGVSVFCITLLMHSTAFGYCSEPSAPDPPTTYSIPTKPSAPFCVNELMRTHTCDDFTISTYNSDLDTYRSERSDYVRKLKNFVSEAGSYANEALEYAKCQIRNMD
jgi:hypothetical protein